MTTRSTSRSVTFRRPFTLEGFDAAQAAGTYVIDVEEEVIESLSFPAYRRLSTQMQVPSNGATEYRTINPAELDEALMRDAEEPRSGPTSSTAQGTKTRLVKRR
jgi:hypothetical protein